VKRGRSYFTLPSGDRWVINDDLLYRSLLKEPGEDSIRQQIAKNLTLENPGEDLVLDKSHDGRLLPIFRIDVDGEIRLREVPVVFRDGDDRPTHTLIPLLIGKSEHPGPRAHLEVHVWHCLNRRHRTPDDYHLLTSEESRSLAKSRTIPSNISRIQKWMIEAEFEAAQAWTLWESPESALENLYLPLALVLGLTAIDQSLRKGRMPPLDRCEEALRSQMEESVSQVERKTTPDSFDSTRWIGIYNDTLSRARERWKKEGPCFVKTGQDVLEASGVKISEFDTLLGKAAASGLGCRDVDPCFHAVPAAPPRPGPK